MNNIKINKKIIFFLVLLFSLTSCGDKSSIESLNELSGLKYEEVSGEEKNEIIGKINKTYKDMSFLPYEDQVRVEGESEFISSKEDFTALKSQAGLAILDPNEEISYLEILPESKLSNSSAKDLVDDLKRYNLIGETYKSPEKLFYDYISFKENKDDIKNYTDAVMITMGSKSPLSLYKGEGFDLPEDLKAKLSEDEARTIAEKVVSKNKVDKKSVFRDFDEIKSFDLIVINGDLLQKKSKRLEYIVDNDPSYKKLLDDHVFEFTQEDYYSKNFEDEKLAFLYEVGVSDREGNFLGYFYIDAMTGKVIYYMTLFSI